MKLSTMFLSCGNEEEAKKISHGLLERNLAACVKRSSIQSMYHWNGQIKEDNEILLMIETAEEKFDEIEKTVTELHSDPYYVLTAVPINITTPGVVKWIEESVQA